MTDGVKLQNIFNEFTGKIDKITKAFQQSLNILSKIDGNKFEEKSPLSRLEQWINNKSYLSKEKKDGYIEAVLSIIENNSKILQEKTSNKTSTNTNTVKKETVISEIISFLTKNSDNLFNFLVSYVNFIHTIDANKIQKSDLPLNSEDKDETQTFANRFTAGIQALGLFSLLIQALIVEIDGIYKNKELTIESINSDKEYQEISQKIKNHQNIDDETRHCKYLLLHLLKDTLLALETSENLNKGPQTPKKQNKKTIANMLSSGSINIGTPTPPSKPSQKQAKATVIALPEINENNSEELQEETEKKSTYSPSEKLKQSAQNVIDLSTKAYQNKKITENKHNDITAATNNLLNTPTTDNLTAYNSATQALTTPQDNTLLGLGVAITAFAQFSSGVILLGIAAAMAITTAGGSLPVSISLGLLAKIAITASIASFFTATTLMSPILARHAGKHSLFNEMAVQTVKCLREASTQVIDNTTVNNIVLAK